MRHSRLIYALVLPASERLTGSTTNGTPNEWYFNAAASDAAHAFRYLTATSLTNGAILVADPAGDGGLAAWNRVCTADC
jgi:hypothetical protein